MIAAAALIVVGAVAFGGGTHASSLRRSEAWTGRVARGPMAIRVRGAGRLVPEEVRWLTAQTSGRVEAVLGKPGDQVAASAPIIRMDNLDVRLLAVQADREVASARAEIIALQRNFGEDRLVREADAAQLRTASGDARRTADADARTAEIVSALERQRAAEQATDLQVRAGLAEKRLALVGRAGPAQLAILQTQLASYEEIARVRHAIVDGLTVVAGADGVLDDVFVEAGQWLVPGASVARVIISDKLKAELELPEEQAGHVAVGQVATVDTRAGTATGRVRRVAAAASKGTVRVEIALDEGATRGARPGQNIDGFVEVDRVADTLFITRPMNVQPNTNATLFRVDGNRATRVAVRVGRASVDSLEILAGLAPGDEVLLSDTSRYTDATNLVLE